MPIILIVVAHSNKKYLNTYYHPITQRINRILGMGSTKNNTIRVIEV